MKNKNKEMTLGEACRTILREGRDAILELLNFDNFTPTDEPKKPTVKMGKIPYEGMWEGKKPKRARGPKGRYKGDDKSTKDVNEAWVGGKAPKKRGKK